ncbi:hypothetical protein PN497_16230 [Sphaerospermopsis kisseleviana CS-549]|uniref:TIGR04255 family protein n=2 Tax=Sphaerospermopsis TaxID=752201 RepID=A0ABR9V7W5_9CYAN|nr:MULTISPECIES: hypothetical protein [Sphaerospermopsis]MBE9234580.1 hypothetical protein [Sphaerospermopsis aphanizomenoides LEGE 00250]MDB9442896.1 hypothetical protein [Sphaerospermopsis kisseleviana CS-549]BAZ79929.1 hypothetical protein NIES73_11760 [Sphaerospermopsis kisseleviana NIES-73]
MSKNFEIQELAIAITARNLNHTVITPDFLKYTGIVPADWELAREPVFNNFVVQIFYKTGVGIVAQPNNVTVVEAIGTKEQAEIHIPKITQQLVEKLSKVDYQRVGINPRGFVTFNSDLEAYQYINGKLLAPGSWQEFEGAKVNASLQLSYPLKRGILNLSINQANVQFPDKVAAAILFSGNFNYSLSGNTAAEKLQDLQQIITNWQVSVGTFQKLLVENFLTSSEAPKNISVFPTMAKS